MKTILYCKSLSQAEKLLDTIRETTGLQGHVEILTDRYCVVLYPAGRGE